MNFCFKNVQFRWPLRPAFAQITLTAILSVWLFFILTWYLPDNGGSGLSLPHNIIGCGVTGLLLFVMGLAPATKKTLSLKLLTLSESIILFGAVLWSIPLAWSPDAVSQTEGSSHVFALWGLLLLLWMLRRLPAPRQRLPVWLTLIWLAAVVQGLFGFMQVTVFAHHGGFAGNRPFGIFQQVNLLASFMATGLACLLFCLIRQRHPSRLHRVAAGFALLFITFMLVLLQSRAGGIGAGLAAILLTAVAARQGYSYRRLTRYWALMLSGVALAVLWQSGLLSQDISFPLPSSFDIRDTSGSTRERWRIIQNTWLMIREHPLLGTGYGGFEHGFADTAVRHGGGIVGRTLIHPHNELLFAWSEGGLFALVGLLIMVIGIVKGLWQPGGMRWCGMALLLPVAVHMNLEYPLYQSVPHGIVLTLLLSLMMSPVHTISLAKAPVRRGRKERLLVMAVGVAIMAYMVGALQTQQALTRIERQNMAPLVQDETATLRSLWNPYPFAGRIDYDRHIALLMRYNQQPDPQLLARFSEWAREYLTHRNDPEIMANLLNIARVMSPQDVPALCRQAHALWPHNPGFPCSSLNSGVNK